ncbi:MAG: DNA polymerase domain-containing protein [Spirochaetaceae bacterium]|nr:DNA polymerase domain-containing protein [Spirochaetaceae bacterium]
MASRTPAETLDVDGREVRVSNPDKVYFPEAGITKLELVRYYLAVAEGAVRAVYDRPIVLKRYVDGITGEGFFQKRAPAKRPDWVPTVELRFPSGRTAHELVVTEPAQLAWMTNLGNIDLNPHAVRTTVMEHPDELRIDLDPCPGVPWEDVRRVAAVTREVLEENRLVGWPKTSGSRGMHVYARIEPRWGFTEVRRAALAVSREVERRAPGLATSKWWKEERVGVFLDYNQNAKDRTIAAAYSVRPNQRAMVSAPLTWDEVPACDPADFTLRTMPARLREAGDPAAGMDAHPGSLESLLEVSARHETEGLGGDAPWPPHFARQRGEPRRVNPSRRRSGPSPTGRRRSAMPLIVIAQAKTEAEAQAGLDRWRARHPEAAACLQPDDVLVDAMRGRHSVWTRIRVNLRHVPEAERPPQEPPDPAYDPSVEWNPRSG